MKTPSLLLGLALTASLAAPAAPSDKKVITAAEAKDHIGREVTVCGKVVAVQKSGSRGRTSWLLHIDKTPPPVFTVIANAAAIDNPFFDADKRYANKDVCVSGYVRDHDGLVHMLLTAPPQIKIVKAKDSSP